MDLYTSGNVFLEFQQGVTPGSVRLRLEIASLSAENQIDQQGSSINWTYDYYEGHGRAGR